MDTRHRVKRFWQYFMQVEESIRKALHTSDEEAIKDWRRELNEWGRQLYDGGIELEVQDDFYELTFHGGANKSKQYICALLKKDAPQQLVDHWIINAFRQPLSQSALHAQVRIGDAIYQGSDFIVYYEVDKDAKCIHTQIYSEALLNQKEAQALTIVYAMLELFIGEVELEARIGDVTILDAPKPDAQNFCLLPNFYEDICDMIVDEGWIEYREPCAIYAVYKLDDNLVSETVRSDMIMVMGTNPQLLEELWNHEQDSCQEAVRFGAQYGYLYYEITQQNEQIAFVRQQLEQEIQELLYPLSLARVIGGAIGTQYGYIDLIVFDADEFATVMQKLNAHLSFPLYYQPFHA